MGVILDWLELAARWIHVIAGVAWIGASFYFNWLNDRLEAPEHPEPGLEGELWSVHGGGFYRAQKFKTVSVDRLPHLHWFKWEAYLTWITGFSLLVLVYYLGAEAHLVDATDAPLGPGSATALGVAVLVLGWWVYNRLCRSPLATRGGLLLGVGFLLIAGVSFGLSQIFTDRAAYIHVGALLGSIMAANVFFVIIPAHVELIRAVAEGRDPDLAVGAHAAMRSRHNNYLTLPVLFVMISGHTPFTYGHRWGWAILMGLFVVGAVTRHGFNVRNAGRPPRWLFPGAALGLLTLALVSTGTRERMGLVGGVPTGPVSYADVQPILVARCITCHAREPANQLFDAAPGGILLETPEQVRVLASRIKAVAVDTRIMPLGNFTEMTDAERAILGAWIQQGAHTDP